MENTINIQINDMVYSRPKAGTGRPGMFTHYGPWHGKTAEFGIARSHGTEQIFIKNIRKKVYKQVVFDFLQGTFDVKGNQKIGVCFLKDGNGLEFSLYIEEIIEVLRKLGSDDALAIWQKQTLRKKWINQRAPIKAIASDNNLGNTGKTPGSLFDFGFFKGDTLIEYKLNHFIVSYQGTIVVVNSKEQVRFVIDLDDSKMSGYRKPVGMTLQEQLKEARSYIDRQDLLYRKRQTGLSEQGG